MAIYILIARMVLLEKLQLRSNNIITHSEVSPKLIVH